MDHKCVLFCKLISPWADAGQASHHLLEHFQLLISSLLVHIGPRPAFHSCNRAEGNVCIHISLFRGNRFLEVDFLGQNVYEFRGVGHFPVLGLSLANVSLVWESRACRDPGVQTRGRTGESSRQGGSLGNLEGTARPGRPPAPGLQEPLLL